MARRMSFRMTTPEFRDCSKTVTRRIGWIFLKDGDHIIGIEKGQGLKKGEKQVVLGHAFVTDVRRERLDAIDFTDVVREGFPDMTRDQFIEMFCKANRCKPDRVVTRIAFKRVCAACGDAIFSRIVSSIHDTNEMDSPEVAICEGCGAGEFPTTSTLWAWIAAAKEDGSYFPTYVAGIAR